MENILNVFDKIDKGYLVIALLVLTIIVIVFVVVMIMNLKKTKSLEQRLMALCSGRDGESLEEEIGKILEDNAYLLTTTDQHKTYIKNLYRRVEKTYQKMSLVKYDGFDAMGGQLSFVLCFLDEKDNGFILNSVHSSSTNYCYSKEIVEGNCAVELGDEELKALEQAKAVKLPMLIKQ